ncbi:MAG: CBS domain-containing protein [Nitrospirales bacterium]
MTPVTEVLRGSEFLDHAAQAMKRLGKKSMPVVDHNQVVGILTDHAIVSETTATGVDPSKILVRQIMTRGEITCSENHSIEEMTQILRQMNQSCLVVLNTEGQPVGIVGQEDVIGSSIAFDSDST